MYTVIVVYSYAVTFLNDILIFFCMDDKKNYPVINTEQMYIGMQWCNSIVI